MHLRLAFVVLLGNPEPEQRSWARSSSSALSGSSLNCFHQVALCLKPFGGFLTRYKLQLSTQDPLTLQETLPAHPLGSPQGPVPRNPWQAISVYILSPFLPLDWIVRRDLQWRSLSSASELVLGPGGGPAAVPGGGWGAARKRVGAPGQSWRSSLTVVLLNT